MATTRERLVAIHEAGHAVIGLDEDLPVTHAFLVEDEQGTIYQGETHGLSWPPVKVPGQAEVDEIRDGSRYGREMLAGMYAEWEYDPNATPGAKGDTDQLNILAGRLFADETGQKAWIAQMGAEVQPLIKARWDAICEVADNLLIKGTQYTADLKAVLAAKPRKP